MTVIRPIFPIVICTLLISLSGSLVGSEVSENLHHSLKGKRIGAQLTSFGLSSPERAGVSAFGERLLLRWETVQRTPIVTGIATAWTLEEQQQYIRSGGSLNCIAHQMVLLWAPPDTVYVSQHRLGVGGTVLFAYKSQSLRERFDNLSGSENIYVVVVLDSANNEPDVPIVAPSFEGQNDLGTAQFTVALISGQPWIQTRP